MTIQEGDTVRCITRDIFSVRYGEICKVFSTRVSKRWPGKELMGLHGKQGQYSVDKFELVSKKNHDPV